MIKSFLSHLYYERKWRHPINQLLIYLRAMLIPYKEPELKFLVFAQGRTGSTVLVDLINQLPGVHCDGEIYGASMPRRIWFPKLYRRSLIKLRKGSIYGFRIKVYDLTLHHKYSQEENRAFIRSFFEEGWKIIYLVREQKLRQALSSMIAESRDQFHFKGDSTKAKAVEVDAGSIPYRLNLLKTFGEEEQKCLDGFDHLKIVYEQDLLDSDMHQNTLDRIAMHLGIPSAEAASRYKRTVTDNLDAQVSNLDEVRAILRSNNLEDYLEEL